MQKLILITGGSGKIGRVLVRNLLESGYAVATNSRSETGVASLIDEFSKFGSCFFGLQADLAGEGGPTRLARSLFDRGLQPFGLINNARNVDYLKPDEMGRISRTNFLSEFALDVVAPYELTMELADWQGSALRKVINVGSMYGSVAANPRLYDEPTRQSPIHYGVCKAALSHLTKELAVRLAPRNIQVNCVAFGGVEGRVDPAFLERYASLTPMGRMLQINEVTGPIEALLSDKFSAMTGHTMAVDGGWGIW
jgi:NAD(P)-dependent dehydrogenase (short-subunit alcohol dehydrogenase family)